MSGKVKLVVRDYWNEDFSHRPYQMVLHDCDDDNTSEVDTITKLLESIGARDGDEIEICVRLTGKRPFGNVRWVWKRPHEYGLESAATAEGE